MVVETLAALGAGVLLGLSIAAPPGPLNALIATNTVTRSRLAGQLTGLGAMTSDAIFLAITLAVGSVVPATREVRVVLFVLGAAVMGFLASRARQALRRELEVKEGGQGPVARAYAAGLALGLTNPFQILWWLTAGLAFLRQVGPPVVVGFLLGILLWTAVFPFTLDLANRRWRGTYRAVILASLALLVLFAAYLAGLAILTAAGRA